MKLTIGSLFAGIGGVCYGFRQAGFQPEWANELDVDACKTYRHNFKHKLLEKDISSIVDPKSELGYVDVITSGFPCQAFSLAGLKKGFDDPRGNMFFETARIINELRPKAFLLENVTNLISHDNYKTLNVIKDVITNDLNYSYCPFIMSSSEHGNIPQSRKRLFIVGFRDEGDQIRSLENEDKDDLFINKETRTGKFLPPLSKRTLTQKITDLIDYSALDDNLFYKKNHKYYKELSKNVTSENSIYQWRRVYVRENKNNLCPTLTANMGTGGHNVPIIRVPEGIRKLTPLECSKFQGFPKSFAYSPLISRASSYKQIGNSVTVPVIKRIALEIKKSLTN